MQNIIDIFLHLDVHLNHWVGYFGPWIYILLFLILFCETGLVVTPFLPGDSLLFALGALAASDDSVLSMPVLMIVLSVAAILGDAVNYYFGFRVGPKIFNREKSRWLNKQHLIEAHAFYEKHGGKTIIFARFIPIIRTFAPFVAGIGKMQYSRFALFNVSGALLWILSLLYAGFYFGNMPVVKNNFELVIIGIILISFLPVIVKFLTKKNPV